MKRKKSPSNNLVTKGYFKTELKKELKKELKIFEAKIDVKLEDLKDEVNAKAKGYRDEILTGLDGVMGELKTMREETAIGAHQVSELSEQVDDHEVRITNLEKPL